MTPDSHLHRSDWADFAEAFCSGYNTHRERGDADDAEAFVRLLNEAHACSGSEQARRAFERMTGQSEGQSEGLAVLLRAIDADAILALAEWALNHPDLNMGSGLHKRNAEEACQRIEAVADLHRRGVASG